MLEEIDAIFKAGPEQREKVRKECELEASDTKCWKCSASPHLGVALVEGYKALTFTCQKCFEGKIFVSSTWIDWNKSKFVDFGITET